MTEQNRRVAEPSRGGDAGPTAGTPPPKSAEPTRGDDDRRAVAHDGTLRPQRPSMMKEPTKKVVLPKATEPTRGEG